MKSRHVMRAKRLTGLLLAALCGSLGTVAAHNAAAKDSVSYHVILEARVLDPHGYLTRPRFSHDMCAAAARVQHHNAEALPDMPSDAVIEQKVYASDGRNFLYKTKELALDVEQMEPDSNCHSEWKHHGVVEIQRGNQFQTADYDMNGQVVTGGHVNTAPAAPPASIEHYSVKRSLNGVAMRCLPPEHKLIQNGFSLGNCIFDDGHGGTLRRGDGSPILIYSKIPSIEKNPGAGSIIEVTPKQVTVGSTIAPSEFTLNGVR